MNADDFITEIKRKENRRGVNPLCYDRLVYLMEEYKKHELKMNKMLCFN